MADLDHDRSLLLIDADLFITSVQGADFFWLVGGMDGDWVFT